ncbi:Ribonuclease H2 subunit A [Quaeritorhiza haematococci]|nr:Ribonuclease H2 subunit A [Quaeritorhiza haematococci]
MTKTKPKTVEAEQAGESATPSPCFDFIPSTPLTDSYSHHSNVPDCCKGNEPVILGVDEAGRGPVLGPMVYALAYVPKSRSVELKETGVDDSKGLTEEQRSNLFGKLQSLHDWVGWAARVLSPKDISTSMLRKAKYNLNALAHDTTVDLIRQTLQRGVNVQEIYIDTVGPPEAYQTKLQGIFPGINITVAKKADSLYPVVSAASICAKVTRDEILNNWKFVESGMEEISREFGSGYPSDPNTTRWLKKSLHPLFGYPQIVRFSWSTCENILEKSAVTVKWDEHDEGEGADIRNYFAKRPATKSTTKPNKGKKDAHTQRDSPAAYVQARLLGGISSSTEAGGSDSGMSMLGKRKFDDDRECWLSENIGLHSVESF